MRPGLQAPGFSDALASIFGYDTRDRLPEIEIPTLIVWGLNDQIVPVEGALGYHRLIPQLAAGALRAHRPPTADSSVRRWNHWSSSSSIRTPLRAAQDSCR